MMCARNQLTTATKQTCHYVTDPAANPILLLFYCNWASYYVYYLHAYFLFLNADSVCPYLLGNETFFAFLYLLHYTSGPGITIATQGNLIVDSILLFACFTLFYSSTSAWVWNMVAHLVYLHTISNLQTVDSCIATSASLTENCQLLHQGQSYQRKAKLMNVNCLPLILPPLMKFSY